MKKLKLSAIATTSSSDVANDYILLHRNNEGAKRLRSWDFHASIEKGMRISSVNNCIIIKTSIPEKPSISTHFVIETTVLGFSGRNPFKVLIQAQESSSGLIEFKATNIGGLPITIGHFLENGKRCFYMPLVAYARVYVKSYNDFTAGVVDFTLATTSTKPEGTEITV